MRNPSASSIRPRRPNSGPFAGFRRDHSRVLAVLRAAETGVLGARGIRPGGHARVRHLVELLERQFATHMTAEDALLYPLLADVLPEARPTLAPLAEDHAELRGLLASLARTLDRRPGRARDEQLAVQVRDLVDLLRLHIQREEKAVFEVAERILGERDARELERRLSEFVAVLSPKHGPAAGRKRPSARARERKP